MHHPKDNIPIDAAEGLRALVKPPFEVPEAIDIRLRARASMHFNVRNAQQPTILAQSPRSRWRAQLAAAAAVVLVACGALMTSGMQETRHAPRHILARGDLNGDGRVDVIDAYMLARFIHDRDAGTPDDPHYDVNRDSMVNAHDMNSIMQAIVNIGVVDQQSSQETDA